MNIQNAEYFFGSWGGHDSLVTDSRSVLRLRGPLTQRKRAGPVISGTWSEVRRWPRLAWQESKQDHWGQCKKCVGKTASFPCASPKASYFHTVKMNASSLKSITMKHLLQNLIHQADYMYNYQCYILIKEEKKRWIIIFTVKHHLASRGLSLPNNRHLAQNNILDHWSHTNTTLHMLRE